MRLKAADSQIIDYYRKYDNLHSIFPYTCPLFYIVIMIMLHHYNSLEQSSQMETFVKNCHVLKTRYLQRQMEHFIVLAM